MGAKWGEKWQIGQKYKNNGVLLLIATDDHKLTIQNGRGVEDALTDYTSSMIIHQYMIPYLKLNNFYEAINSGTDQIINVLQGKFKADNKGDDDTTSGIVIAIFIFFIILLYILMHKNNKNNTYYDRNGKRRNNDDDFWGGLGGFIGGSIFGGGSSSGSGSTEV